jgi:hypothetical protein
VNYAKNRVGADKIIRLHRGAVFHGIALQLGCINRIGAAIPARRTTIQLRLIDVDSFLVFSARPIRLIGRTGTAVQSITGRILRWREHAIVRNIVVFCGGASTRSYATS